MDLRCHGSSFYILLLPAGRAGATLMLWALLGFPVLARAIGVVRTSQAGSIGLATLGLLVPLSSIFRGNTAAAQGALTLAVVLKAISNNNAFAACIILVNAAAMNVSPGVLGKVNGIGQTAAALVRAIGPTLGGLCWSLSVTAGSPFLAFLVISGIAALTAALYEKVHETERRGK